MSRKDARSETTQAAGFHTVAEPMQSTAQAQMVMTICMHTVGRMVTTDSTTVIGVERPLQSRFAYEG